VPAPDPILDAAAQVQDLCRERGWRFCFIGGLAVLRWGEPRLTRDADLTLITGYGSEEPYVTALLERFPGRFADSAAFALANRVLLLRAGDDVPIDIALGALPFEERAVERASDYAYSPGWSLRTCGAEDLIVLKAFAGRPQDWLDIEGIVTRRGGGLDAGLVLEEAVPLLELRSASGDAQRLRALLDA
jgi:hypothetical protein